MPWIDPDFPKTATPTDLVGRVLGLNPGMMTGPGTNTYLVGRRDPILIDTGIGLPEYVPNLDGYLRERGWRQPSRVVLTHRHRDHIGGVAHLRERFGGLRVSKMIHRDAGLPDGIDDLRERQILDALSAGPSVIPDVVKRVYVDVAPALHGIAAMSVESHLKKLKREGRVRETVQRDAPSRWELVG